MEKELIMKAINIAERYPSVIEALGVMQELKEPEFCIIDLFIKYARETQEMFWKDAETAGDEGKKTIEEVYRKAYHEYVNAREKLAELWEVAYNERDREEVHNG